MDKRDKRVVGAAVAAAIIVAIAVLGVGWYSASRDDAGLQAGGPTAGGQIPGSTPTANAESEGPAAQTATGSASAPSQSGQNSGTQPAQGQPAQTQSTQAQPAQEQPAQTQTSQAQPAQEQPAQTQSTQAQPAQEQPAQTQTSQVQPAQEQPAQTQSTQVQPAQEQPAQTQTSQVQPAQEQPVQTQTTQAQPTQQQPAQTQTTQAQPAQEQPAQTQTTQIQPAQAQPTQEQPAQEQPTQEQPAQVQTAQVQPATGAASPNSADPATSQATSQATSEATSQAATPTTADTESPPAGRTVLTDEQVAALPAIMPPSFDVVRVNDVGDAVIAGRAAPRSVVIIYDGDREIGRVAADSRGEWVYVSERPLVPGQHEIGLLSLSGPQSRLSDQVVVLIAPEPRQDIAGQPTEGNPEREKPLALLVPRGEIGATTVLQSPPAVVTERAPEEPASRVEQPAIASSTATTAITPSGDSRTPTASAGTEAPVSIDIVDYDEAGRLIVSGRSTPQSDVRLYLDNEFVGTARTTDDGSFEVQPAEPVDPGVYALRIDEVSPVGSVTARAETPFQRANEVAGALPGHSRIVVQPGNSLWRIARQVYGQGVQYTVIYQANTGQIRNPDLIYPGQIFDVPEVPKDVPAGDPS